VAPELAKVEYEDARVRVVRLHIPEHASLLTHDRPRRVVVSLTPNHVLLTRSDGTTSETRTEAGAIAWSEPAVRSVLNLGSPVENIVVELKQTVGPGKPLTNPPAALPFGYLNEPRHKWVLENQYVRVYDVRIPPGETTTFHRHAYDQVSVYVSGGLVSVQSDGQPWGQPATIEPRGISFSADAAKPITHRVRNDGKTEYHVVLVQFLE
jgi:quercetin dioxygenase-like cupin family protein